MFVKGQLYRRQKLHERYGGQQQGGISTPSEHNIIFLFAGARGEEHGYSDKWVDANTYWYTGEGQRGDMEFLRGNKAIRDHREDGKDIHLFILNANGTAEYVDQMICNGYHFDDGADTDGQVRKMIIFELSRVE